MTVNQKRQPEQESKDNDQSSGYMFLKPWLSVTNVVPIFLNMYVSIASEVAANLYYIQQKPAYRKLSFISQVAY